MSVPNDIAERANGETSRVEPEVAGSEWFNEGVLGRGTPPLEPQADSDSSVDQESTESTSAGSAATEAQDTPTADSKPSSAPDSGPKTFTLTEEQIEAAFQQRIHAELPKLLQTPAGKQLLQSEADKRFAAEKRRQRLAKLEQIGDETSPDYDPYEYARQSKELKDEISQELEQQNTQSMTRQQQQQLLMQTMSQTATVYDHNIISPLIVALPAQDRSAVIDIINGEGHPVQQRAKAVIEAVRRIETNALSKAEQRLRGNAAFKKQLLSELRGAEDEPEVFEGSVPPPAYDDSDMNAILRGMRTTTRRRR